MEAAVYKCIIVGSRDIESDKKFITSYFSTIRYWRQYERDRRLLLMVLHAHVIAAAKVILSSMQVTTPAELVKSLVERFLLISLNSKCIYHR